MAKETFVLTFITNRGLFHLNDLSLLKRRNMDMSTKVYVFVTASCHKTHIFVLPKYFFFFHYQYGKSNSSSNAHNIEKLWILLYLSRINETTSNIFHTYFNYCDLILPSYLLNYNVYNPRKNSFC